jgi:hypothetical protein
VNHRRNAAVSAGFTPGHGPCIKTDRYEREGKKNITNRIICPFSLLRAEVSFYSSPTHSIPEISFPIRCYPSLMLTITCRSPSSAIAVAAGKSALLPALANGKDVHHPFRRGALVGVACQDRPLVPHSLALPSSASGNSEATSNHSGGKQGILGVNDCSAIVSWVFDEMYLWFGSSIYLYSVSVCFSYSDSESMVYV